MLQDPILAEPRASVSMRYNERDFRSIALRVCFLSERKGGEMFRLSIGVRRFYDRSCIGREDAMATTTISSKFQVVIPKEVRGKLHRMPATFVNP